MTDSTKRKPMPNSLLARPTPTDDPHPDQTFSEQEVIAALRDQLEAKTTEAAALGKRVAELGRTEDDGPSSKKADQAPGTGPICAKLQAMLQTAAVTSDNLATAQALESALGQAQLKAENGAVALMGLEDELAVAREEVEASRQAEARARAESIKAKAELDTSTGTKAKLQAE